MNKYGKNVITRINFLYFMLTPDRHKSVKIVKLVSDKNKLL